jgi:hypothetical protein
MQSFSRFGKTQVAGDSVENPQLAEGGIFQLSKAEVKSLKM